MKDPAVSSLDQEPVNEDDLGPLEEKVLGQIVASEIVDLLQRLIQQRSDYPPGDCRSAMNIVEAKLTSAGVPFRIFSRQPNQPNLIAAIGPREQKPRLMFHSHIDTVPAGELDRWSVEPFAGTRKGERIYGRGAGDDKSSVVAQLMSVVALARAGVSLEGTLQLVVVSDEESGGEQGTYWLHQEHALRAEALVVGEQTDNRIAIAERVACGIDLTVFGKSAHGAMPWVGENAVLKAARALTWLQDTLFLRLLARKHPYLPPPTLNVGRIQGGVQWSIVPERCKIEMDRRLLPGETRETAIEEIRQALDDYAASVEPLRYELFSTGEVAANIDTPPGDPFVTVASQVLKAICGEERPLTGYVQTSDGRWFARDGIPIILFGPSDPAVAHAVDEWVSMDQLIEAARFYALLPLRWMKQDGR
ncbi:MAG: M20 family metallopeptidase [Anaerolineales bacterium]